MADVKLRWLGATSTGAGRTNNAVYSVVGWGDGTVPIIINDHGALLADDGLSSGNWELVSAVSETLLFP